MSDAVLPDECVLGGVRDDQHVLELSCDVSDSVLLNECVSECVSDDQPIIDLFCDVTDAVLSDDCVSECDSDEHSYNCMEHDSENESVKWVEDICGVNGMNVLNKCESVEFVCENENRVNKNCDCELKNVECVDGSESRMN